MNTALDPAKHTEKRHAHRQHTYKGGKILTGVQRAIVDCTVRDLCDTGAKLRVGDGSFVPADFLLYIPVDQTCYKVQVRHREGQDVGVEILQTVEKPQWLHL